MTRDEIMAMSDDELVRRCQLLLPGGSPSPIPWNPLEDWNAAMEVVAAMDKRNFDYMSYRKGSVASLLFHRAKSKCMDPVKVLAEAGAERRAILRAVLIAMGGER